MGSDSYFTVTLVALIHFLPSLVLTVPVTSASCSLPPGQMALWYFSLLP